MAVYSSCERYRYRLTRVWSAGPQVLFVMLNPSTATELQNDPTVERCERRARALGFGSFAVANIFAIRATDPRVMRADTDPVGPGNDLAILEVVAQSERIVCGWGSHGAHLGRGAAVEALLRGTGRDLHQLGLTLAGAPKHPLYISYDRQPELWPGACLTLKLRCGPGIVAMPPPPPCPPPEAGRGNRAGVFAAAGFN